MDTQYDRFYNLHIPKTGGTFFKENLLHEMKAAMKMSGISVSTHSNGGTPRGAGQEKTVANHLCWYKPYVQEKSYIFTTLRDPAKRLISHYAWQAVRAIAYRNSSYTTSDIGVDNFYKWLGDNPKAHKNFQSKNLVYYNEDHTVYTEGAHLGWALNGVPQVESFLFAKDFADYEIDKNILNSNINRIDLILKSEDMRSLDMQLIIRNKIMSDLGLDIPQTPLKTDAYGHVNPLSNDLYKKFNAYQIERLYEFNDIDSEIYFNNSTFSEM